jgi:predicted nucleic acid-binding protein
MNVLVDTSVWSLAFRKQPRTDADERVIQELSELIRELRVVMLGPVRQELLSGILVKDKFEQLRVKLREFDDEILSTEHYELAASFSNECRRHGIQGSHTDFLLCAVGVKNGLPIFTLDKDFDQYKSRIPIKLHGERKGL